MKDGIADYVILEGTASELQKQVGLRLDEGWVPLGGVTVATGRGARGEAEPVFVQAMIRSAAHKQNLAVTVPLVMTNEISSATTVTIPSVTTPADNQVACPHCQIAIRARTLQPGTNRCEKCRREFVVEWGEIS